jgi:hypothetical protein
MLDKIHERSKTHNLGQRLDRSQILKVIRVGDLAGSPFTFVGRVVDHRSIPLPLIGRIRFEGSDDE